MGKEAAIVRRPVEGRILLIRGRKVPLDGDLAELYGVSVKRLNEQVKRNLVRFPADFMFQLTIEEYRDLRSQIAASSSSGVTVDAATRRSRLPSTARSWPPAR